MTIGAHLAWPFFTEEHRRFAREIDAWAAANVPRLCEHHGVDDICRRLVEALGSDGWLAAIVPLAYGGRSENLDVRTIALAREVLAFYSGLADFAFAMQGLGTGPITLFGSDQLKARYLPPVKEGKRIAAFALSEPGAGSDVASLSLTATKIDETTVRLDGAKTWISNGGIADHYVVFARTEQGAGARGLSAFVVDADMPGLTIGDRIDTIAPHPLATLIFEDCRVPLENRLGGSGDGFKIAMTTLDIFRSTVGAAALGFASRALESSLQRLASRMIAGSRLGDYQIPQGMIADSATDLDAARLLVYRAAWTKDSGSARVTREAAMAKMFATEAAQQIIDRAVQLFGGEGVRSGSVVEELYREIRALRIYEGATEVQKLIIARDLAKAYAEREKKPHSG